MKQVLFATLALASCGASAPTEISGRARAIDGDTIAIDFRLTGVDALERRQLCQRSDGCWPCGKVAQDFVAHILTSGNATVVLTSSRSYERPVAIVTVGGTDLGERLLRAGLAVPRIDFLQDDPGRLQAYTNAYADAVNRKAGIHAGEWIDPRQWRSGSRLACEPPASSQRSYGLN